MSKHRRLLQALSIVVILSMMFSGVSMPAASAQGNDGLKREVNPQTGKVSFLGSESGRALSARALGITAFARPEDPGMALAQRFAPEFGLKNPARDLTKLKTNRSEDGRLAVRYQQSYQGIPVMGGELIVNTNERGDLYSMNGEVSPDLSLSTQPTVDSEQARQTALESTAKWYEKAPEDFVATEPELWIYDESLLRPSTHAAELVWRMEVTAVDTSLPVRELVLVNAERGHISLHFNQVDTAWGGTEKESTLPVLNTTQENPKSNIDRTTPNSTSNAPATQTGTTWYVATTGSDSNLCSDPNLPCATINGAIGKATAGDTVKIAIGTYTGTGTEAVLINKSINLSGGWDENFAEQNVKSIIDGQGARRGIDVESNITAIIERVLIRNGNASQGGGIYVNSGGALTLNNSNINGNAATWGGGGGIYIKSNAMVTLNNSTVSGNNGTGINNYGTLTLNNSTISASTNSGIFNSGGMLTLNNSTLSGNTGIGSGGGGILNESATATLNNSTISGNTTTFGPGGGIYNLSGLVSLKNTIIANNSAKSSGPDCSGTISSTGYNLIGNTSGCTFTPSTGDLTNVSIQLSELISSPGYYPLQAGSPAIDAGNPAAPGSGDNACLTNDQRGVTRPVGARCDIGAYEYTVPGSITSLLVISGDGQRAGPGFTFTNPLKIAAVDAQGSPVPDVSITLIAPESGASGTFVDTGTRTSTVITDMNGIATISTFTANAQLGSYTVVASTNGVESVGFNLQNIGWYVATNGRDTNNCLTPATPCGTINGVLVKAGFIAGDTVLVAEGTYGPFGDEVVLLNRDAHLSGGWNAAFTTQNGWSTIDGGRTRRGITVTASATIERFVVQNGSSASGGGGIYNGGTLVLNNSLVRNNTCCSEWVGVDDMGAGISNWGILTVNNSTITNNISFDSGGGLYNNRYGTLILNNSTISGNEAYSGAGLLSSHTVILNNSTVSGNRAITGSGGGGGYGGGIYFNDSYGGTFTIQNSLIADNSATSRGPDCYAYGLIRSAGYNLIGNNSDCTFATTTGDLVGTSANPINPRLNALQNNGGLTPTHALGIGSPAIDAGSPATPGSGGSACLGTDQRGVTRPAGARCDIGAYEGSVAWIPLPLVSTYTAGNGTALPGAFLCNQADPTCAAGDSHAKAAHRYAIGIYNLYAIQHDRNSIDNHGMTVISSVHYSSGYANANWTGEQMVYGDRYGFPLADDVVAHELTHGVTQYESNLFYYYQSGAINESFSDLWGEYYDQTNGLGNDGASVKWQMGEDVSGQGALRSMSNPTLFGDPDRMTSANYYFGTGDGGGVHHNSGVNNKAVYLMVDGGTFNGKTVTGLGWDKTAAIYYEANTNLLTSGADYSDLYYALQQACSNVIGQKGITAADCAKVKDALDAVEMNTQLTPSFNSDAPYCSPYETRTTVFSDDLESGKGNWTFTNGAYPRWQYDSPYGPYAHSGSHFLYADDDPDTVTDASARLTSLAIPANAYLRFAHAYEFETYLSSYYDGGVLEYSINGGSTWTDAGSLIAFNGYKGTLYTGYGNPLSGRSAFASTSHGYISTRVNLASLAGKTVTFRWRMGLDNAVAFGGWWLDDVELYQCQDITPPVVSSIRRASGSPTSATKVYFTVNFSEPVNGVDSNDFILNAAGGVSGASIESVTGSGAAFMVMVNTGTGGGTLRLDVRGTASISDLVGHPLANAPFTGGEMYNMNSGERYDATVTRMGDFNGDGKSEIAVFRPTTSTWHIYGLGDFVYGTVGDIPVIADYNGDGKDDIAVFRPTTSTWHIYGVGDFVYGTVGDIPVIADYNGDGKDDIAVFRPTTSTWHIYGLGDFVYGTVGDIPVIADYNGDGKADIAVFRPSTSTWHIYGLGDFVYGAVGDIPVIADYNGDGKADIAVFRPTTSTWHIYGLGDFVYGTVGDIPVIADYNGDGKADIAVFRPTTSTWHLYGVGDFIYGTVGDIPV